MYTARQLAAITLIAGTGLAGTIGIAAAASSESNSAPTETPSDVDAEVPTDLSVAAADDTSGDSGEPIASPSAAEASPADEPSELLAAPTAELLDTPSASSPDSPVAPADSVEPDDPEEPAPGEPGVFEGDETATDPPPPPPPPPPSGPTDLAPVPQSPPPPPPIPGPVDLVTPPMDPGPPPIDDFVAPVDPTPFDGPSDFQVTPLPGHAGTITSGLSGCQLDCVTSALLTANPANPNMQLDAVTTVPVHFEVEVSEVNGSWSEHFNNPGYDTTWSKTLGPLQPDTTYDLTMIAIDQDGHSQVYEHRFTTVAIVDGFASNATGCQFACLTFGEVELGGAPNAVEVHVEANSPAALQVWFSTSEPTWVGDPDAKPAHGPVFENENPSTSWTFDVGDLEFDTRYHIVARAHDEHGEHYRIGTFRTGVEPTVDVLVTFEQITVTHDGDKGKLNRGELRFSWGFDGAGIGGRSEEKMHAGTVDIGANNAEWFRFDPATGAVPNPTIGAHERDADGLVEFCSAGTGPGVAPSYSASCDTKTNVAHHGGPISLEQIMDFPTCAEWGIDAGIGSRCAALGTSIFGSRDLDYAHFSTIVSFFVVD